LPEPPESEVVTVRYRSLNDTAQFTGMSSGPQGSKFIRLKEPLSPRCTPSQHCLTIEVESEELFFHAEEQDRVLRGEHRNARQFLTLATGRSGSNRVTLAVCRSLPVYTNSRHVVHRNN
jgi:hypothetical protein